MQARRPRRASAAGSPRPQQAKKNAPAPRDRRGYRPNQTKAYFGRATKPMRSTIAWPSGLSVYAMNFAASPVASPFV